MTSARRSGPARGSRRPPRLDALLTALRQGSLSGKPQDELPGGPLDVQNLAHDGNRPCDLRRAGNEACCEDLQTVFGKRGQASRCQCQRHKLRPRESFA
jgi:hypothetical protein